MINKIKGSLLDINDGYIIHGCNAQGVMGSGVARLIKYNYYGAYCVYKRQHENFIDGIGKSPVGVNSYYKEGGIIIVNAITQEFCGNDGKRYTDYFAVRECFCKLNKFIMGQVIDDIERKVNFPLIGCGLGGGDWSVIEKIIDEELDESIEKNLWVLPE